MNRQETESGSEMVWRSWHVLVVACAVVAVLVGCASAESLARSASPTRVELWCVGDDVLTLRFRDALEGAIQDDPDLTLALGNETRTTGTVVATIEENLRWKTVGSRTEVSYKVRFESSTGKILGNSSGSCWEDELSHCVSRAVGDLKLTVKGTN